MSQSQSSVTAQDEIASTYERNGFVVPIDVLSHRKHKGCAPTWKPLRRNWQAIPKNWPC